MAYRTRWTRLLRGAVLAATAALAAVGCTSGSASTATGGTAGATAPAVTLAQASQAFASYVATSDTAARTGDATLALSDVTGMQWAQVNTGFKTYRSLHLPPPYTRFTYQTPTLYLPAPAGYPRWFAASVTRAPRTPVSDGVLPVPEHVVMLFEQASATAPWQLASTSELPDGVSLPVLAVNEDGQRPQVAMSQTAALLARPDVVGPLLAAVVDDGPSSPAARAVATGPLTTSLYQAARAGMGLSTPPGDVHQWELDGSNYTQFALRTADGGALVFFTMYLDSTIAVPAELNESEPVNPGPPITVPGELKVLLPAGTAAPRVELERQDLLSFAAVDPPAGAGKIQVIALGDALNYASAS